MNIPIANEKTTVYLPPIVRRFAKMRAAQTNVTLSAYMAGRIQEEMEDLEDIRVIEQIMKDPDTEWIAWEDALKDLETDDKL